MVNYKPLLVESEQFLKEAMNKHGDDVKRLAYAYVRDIELAKDISQDVFVKCYEKCHEFRGESSLKTWLLKITANHCKDYLRSGHYKYMKVQQIIGNLIKSNNKTPEEELILKSQSDELTNCILRLPKKYKEVIILYYYQELSINEISNLLERNINTIKTRLNTARKLLGKHYKRDEGRNHKNA